MDTSSEDHTDVGALVRDEATGRRGLYMGTSGPYAMLRPLGGGREWEVRPEDVRAEVSVYPHVADVARARGALRMHVAECGECAPGEPCALGRSLRLACEEAR
ncbi:hypothetical protein RM780_13235 [Streptomyces sp. DSM 44917]|uniref:Uncharacterized protein n=1 Tax=Streptomyces boetiae TaxID=3075541 RepID=A0ABU2L8U5_9ACTN|nr:hypothetical protein [Streptomyces sp. DSM 44917]MDT0307920.1 hypothetical protein [Streptomyces sp. DSM 44917]